MKFKIGTKLLCTKNFYMYDCKTKPAYLKGKVYQINKYDTGSDGHDRYVFASDFYREHLMCEETVSKYFSDREHKLKRILNF